jgi:hypothetical protein
MVHDLHLAVAQLHVQPECGSILLECHSVGKGGTRAPNYVLPSVMMCHAMMCTPAMLTIHSCCAFMRSGNGNYMPTTWGKAWRSFLSRPVLH